MGDIKNVAAFAVGKLPADDAALAKGFTDVSPPQPNPWFGIPQENDAGENYVGDPATFGGFAGRPHGSER